MNGVTNFNFPQNSHLTEVNCWHPFAGGLTGDGLVNDNGNLAYGGAVNDRGYRMKCACYDEVKLDSMKVTLTPASVLSYNNVTFTVCSFWDRKASPKEVGFVSLPGDGAGVTYPWMANGSMPTAIEIFNNEGTIKSPMTQNTIYGIKRMCYASSSLEKGGYFDSSILYNPTENQSPLTWVYQDAWFRNPLQFSPSLNVVLYSPAASAVAGVLTMSYKVEYTFTFRNPKSDLDYFLTVEAPGYVNPMGRGMDDDRNRESPLTRDLNKIYALKTAGASDLPTAASVVGSLFKEAEAKDDKKDEDVEVVMKDEE